MLIDKRPRGKILIPPSKSISHRGLICGALSGGGTVSGVSDNLDTQMTLNCLKLLGAGYSRVGNEVSFYRSLSAPEENTVFDCGESGSTLRFLIPIAAVFGAPVKFTGKGRLMERPLAPYADCLSPRGALLRQESGFASVCGRLTPGLFRLDGDISSQFVTGLLFSLPLLDGDSVIEMNCPLQSRSYVDLTLAALRDYDITVENHNYTRFSVPGGQKYKPCSYTVEGDYSSASFFLAAGALGCDIECAGLNPASKQGDRKFLDIITACGGAVDWTAPDTVRISADGLDAVTVDVSDIPDLVPPLAALMCFCRGRSRIINAARLRLKESDRLMSVASELRRLGARITEGDDFLEIEGTSRLRGGKCHAHNDHRIPMMIAVASLISTGPVYIDEPDCVAKSYPDFWKDFMKI